ncbi:MAG: DUF429 domain-containing protein [Myxococcota bacterium]
MIPPPLNGVCRVLGVDLCADEGETSAAACLLWTGTVWRLEQTPTLNDDQAILKEIENAEVVALDGPRRPPRGFVDFVAKGESPPTDCARSRSCEREHTRRVCPIFYSSPVATLGMQRWMRRSWKLFSASDQKPLEIYPMGGFVSTLNGVQERKPHELPSKSSRAGRKARLSILKQLLGPDVEPFAERQQGGEKAHDRVDAIMAAATAAAYSAQRYVSMGDDTDGRIVVPDLNRVLPAGFSL